MTGQPDRQNKGFAKPVARRELLIGGALLGSATVAHALVPRGAMNLLGTGTLETLIPKQVGEWSFYSKAGLVLPPADQLSAQLYANLLTRVYVAENRLPIMLLIAQSPAQSGILQVHRPEVCYPFGGYALSGRSSRMISVPGGRELRTRVFTATKQNRIEQLLYWTRIGDAFPGTWLQQRVAVAKANLRGIIPDAVMVRVSVISPDVSSVVELDAFIKALLGAMQPAQREVLIGSSQPLAGETA